jgi:hypothetical protein
VTILYVPWHPESLLFEDVGPPRLWLPGSIPAALSLQDRGISALRSADLLGPADFQEIWRRVVPVVWASVEDCLSAVGGREPETQQIFAYSLVNLLSSVLALITLLDRIHERHVLAEIHVDAAQGWPKGDDLFCDDIHNSIYCDVAMIWGAANGIKSHQRALPTGKPLNDDLSSGSREAPRALSPVEPATSLYRRLRRRAAPLRRWVETLPGRWTALSRRSRVFKFLSVLCALARRRRIIVFTNYAVQLPPKREQHGRSIAVVSWGDYSPPAIGQASARQAFDKLVASVRWPALMDAPRSFDDYLGYIKRRLWDRFESLWPAGLAMYRHAGWLARAVKRGGAVPVLLADGPFTDFMPNSLGFAAEAFRQYGGKIAEVQHGGNMNLTTHGFIGPLLTTGLGDLLLEWNDVGCRDYAAYGVSPPHLKFVTVGCWKTKDIRLPAKKEEASPVGRPLRVAYATALLSAGTISGRGLMWDDYLVLLDRVFTILDRSDLSVDVSFFGFTEMQYLLAHRSYPNIRFHSFAFRRISAEADVLIADSLNGSPYDEAMMSDKPVIVFTGADAYEFDPGYLADVRSRCIAYDDMEEYVAGLGQFASDPHAYLRRNPRTTDPELMMRYFAPTNPRRFWEALGSLASCEPETRFH